MSTQQHLVLEIRSVDGVAGCVKSSLASLTVMRWSFFLKKKLIITTSITTITITTTTTTTTTTPKKEKHVFGYEGEKVCGVGGVAS